MPSPKNPETRKKRKEKRAAEQQAPGGEGRSTKGKAGETRNCRAKPAANPSPGRS